MFAVAVYLHSYDYRCKNCGKVFRPDLKQCLLTIHAYDDFMLRCPHCGKKDWCTVVDDKKSSKKNDKDEKHDKDTSRRTEETQSDETYNDKTVDNDILSEYEQALRKLGLTKEKVEEMKKNARYDEKGHFIQDRSKPYGSVENPVVVGMPDCSDSLFFDWRNGRWILTDGLGNGWIR